MVPAWYRIISLLEDMYRSFCDMIFQEVGR